MVAREDRQPNHAFVAWADALLSNPSAAVSDILEGRGTRGALQLAEPGDFLSDLLAQPSLRTRRDALVEAIDRALIEWMEERIAWPPDRVARFGTRAYVAQFSDALAAVARLPLSSSPMRLIDNVGTWDDRFRSMRWPDDVDLLREFDLALAQHQSDKRLASRWFASCDEAAWTGPYWRDGLGIALLGLRKIPDPTTTQPERLVATALARFAALSSQRRTDSPNCEPSSGTTCRLWRSCIPDTTVVGRNLGERLGESPRVRARPVSSPRRLAPPGLAKTVFSGHLS